MAAFTTIAAVAGAAFAAKGYVDQRAAAKDQQAAMGRQAAAQDAKYKADAQRAEIQNIRSVRQQYREQRIRAAQIIGRGATTGTSMSSGVAGGVSSVGSQFTGNLNYMSDIADTQTATTAASQAYGQASYDVGVAQGNQAKGAALQALGGTIFSGAGGFKTVFDAAERG